MNNQSVIVSKVVYSNDFEIVYKLVSYENEGFSLFNDKWGRSDSGEVMDDRGNKWTCSWYAIGNDVSVENAQKEFDRDCEAFDVHLFADVNYNFLSCLSGSELKHSNSQHFLKFLSCLSGSELIKAPPRK